MPKAALESAQAEMEALFAQARKDFNSGTQSVFQMSRPHHLRLPEEILLTLRSRRNHLLNTNFFLDRPCPSLHLRPRMVPFLSPDPLLLQASGLQILIFLTPLGLRPGFGRQMAFSEAV